MKVGGTIDVNLSGLQHFWCKIVNLNEYFLYDNYPKEIEFISLKNHHKCDVYYLNHSIPNRFNTTFEKFVEVEVSAFVLNRPMEKQYNEFNDESMFE